MILTGSNFEHTWPPKPVCWLYQDNVVYRTPDCILFVQLSETTNAHAYRCILITLSTHDERTIKILSHQLDIYIYIYTYIYIYIYIKFCWTRQWQVRGACMRSLKPLFCSICSKQRPCAYQVSVTRWYKASFIHVAETNGKSPSSSVHMV